MEISLTDHVRNEEVLL